jgi:YD repeat-containing protein
LRADPEGLVTEYEYDTAGRLAVIRAPGNRATVYERDGNGRRTELTQTPTGGSGQTVGYAYDQVTGDLDSITDWNGNPTEFVFTDDGLLHSVTRDNGVESLHNYRRI